MRNLVGRCMRSGIPQLGAQIGALWLVSLIAEAVVARLPVPIPAGAIGMAMLFALLCARLIPLAAIEHGATLLVRHLALFLVPYAVSIMAFADLMLASGIALAVSLIGSTLVGMAATGFAAQTAAQTSIERRDSVRRAER